MITTGRLRGGEPQQLRKADPLVIMGKWRSGQPGSHDHDRGDGSGRNAVVMIMGVWSLGHGAPNPKPPLPPPLPVRAQPELVISRLLVGQTGRIAHRSDRKS